MTAATLHRWGLPGVVVAAGLAALALRVPSAGAVAIVSVVGLAGLMVPDPCSSARAGWPSWAWCTAAGLLAFAVVRAMAGPVGVPAVWSIAVVGLVAAAGEEAFFRRLAYGWLARLGAPVAVAATAAAFALVHVPTHGLWTMGLNFGAGLVFGWQRWATGTWTAPAVTHAGANLMQMGW